jgi:hypothetical protein
VVLDGLQRVLTFGLHEDLEPLAAQVHPQQIGDGGLVFHDEHHAAL